VRNLPCVRIVSTGETIDHKQKIATGGIVDKSAERLQNRIMRRLVFALVLSAVGCKQSNPCDLLDPSCSALSSLFLYSRIQLARYVYIPNAGGANIAMFRADTFSGYLTSLGTIANHSASPGTPHIDLLGRFLYFPGTGDLSSFTIDQQTGLITYQGFTTSTPASLPTGRVENNFLYIPEANLAYAYSADQTTGLLTLINTQTAGASSNFIHIEGNFAISSNAAAGGPFYTYSIQSNGSLSLTGSPAGAGGTPGQGAIDVSGNYYYAATSTPDQIEMFSINQSTDTITSLGAPVATGTSPTIADFDPGGKYVYVVNGTNITTYVENSATGLLTQGSSVPTGSSPGGGTLDPTGRFLYVNASGGIYVYTIDLSSGTLSLIQTFVIPTGGTKGPRMDPQGRFLYMVSPASNLMTVASIDSHTGLLSLLQTVTGLSTPNAGVIARYWVF